MRSILTMTSYTHAIRTYFGRASRPLHADAAIWNKLLSTVKSPAVQEQITQLQQDPELLKDIENMKAVEDGPVKYEGVNMNELPAPGATMDWSKINEYVVSEEGKKQLLEIKKVFDEVEGFLAETSKPVEEIDWAHWRKVIRTPGIVDEFKNTVDNLTYPTLDLSPYVKQLQAEAAKFSEQIDTYVSEVDQAIGKIETDLSAIETDKPLNQQTPQDVLRADPQLAKEIHAELKEHNWNP